MPKRLPPARVSSVVYSAVESAYALEGLETRRLMAATLPRLGDVLGYLATDFSTRSIATQSRATYRHKQYVLAAKQPNKAIVQTVGDTVLVRAVANEKGGKKLQAQLVSIGAAVTGMYGGTLSAAVPVSALKLFNGLSTLKYADAAYAPITNTGQTDDYGVQAMNADKAQKQYAVDGSGVTVGILSDSFNKLGGASAGVASGDLPNVNVLKDSPYNDTDEGRGMAEIVHDVAPGANIAFHTAYVSEPDFASGIVRLAQPTSSGGGGARVIVDDVFYLDEPYFQDGIVAQAVNTAATTYGATYFSAAGNQGRQSYEATFSPTASMTIAGVGTGVFQDFDPSSATNVYQQVTIPAGGTLKMSMQWNAPYYSASQNAGGTAAPTNSVGIYLLNSSKTQLLSAAADNRVGSDPYQIMSYTNGGTAAMTAYVAMKVTAGTAPTYVKYIDFGNTTINQFATNSGTAIGHAVASGGRAVGAAAYFNTPAFNVSPAVKETFSSAGGVPVFFNADGTPKAAAEYRNQPSVVGPDGAATTFFGSQYTDFDGQNHFFGTSAAAPHVAAVAALLLQAKASLTNSAVYSTLESTAQDMGTAGFDYDTGYGLVRADAAIQSIAASSISGVVTQNGAPASGQTVFLDSNNNGTRDSGTGTIGSSASVAIPDAMAANGSPSRVTSSVTSTLTGRVTGLTVSVNESHAMQGDVGLTLITPSGVRIPLLTNLGNLGAGGTGVDLTLSDAATTYIQNIYNPSGVLTGTYKPQTPLSAAVGESASGTWQLEARDYRSGNTGTINNWSLNISYADPSTTTDANGAYGFTALTPSAFYGTYRVRASTANGLTQTSSPIDLTLSRSSNVTGANLVFASNTPLSTIASTTIDDGTAQRSRVRTVTVTFNGTIPAAGINSGAFALTQTSGTISSWQVNVQSVTTPSAGQTAVTLAFSGPALQAGSLTDGRYTLTVNGSLITDTLGRQVDAGNNGAAGSTGTVNFFRLYADANGTANVDFNDFLLLQNAFGSTSGSPAFIAGLDSNADNTIDFNDFLALQNNFGKSI